MEKEIKNIMRTYKVTESTAQDLFERKAKAICECCNKKITNKRKIHIDHNHQTGIVRGVVCASCNITFGKLENRPENIKAKYWYAERGKLHHLDWITYRGYN